MLVNYYSIKHNERQYNVYYELQIYKESLKSVRKYFRFYEVINTIWSAQFENSEELNIYFHSNRMIMFNYAGTVQVELCIRWA